MLCYYLYRVIVVRNKDNTWPEEMITLVKELKAKEKKKQLTAAQSNAVGQFMINTIFTIVVLVALILLENFQIVYVCMICVYDGR